ncbi:hypothetical protein FRC08_018458 [Ceratobasidium sp. 394]|nr:hypothetical protein FRC08_018458 [Ceratobasidium sp. 394]KAG9091918.1 hypothetical protein FS749_016140 [Ceratobasidium sp. UAMH 11750]
MDVLIVISWASRRRLLLDFDYIRFGHFWIARPSLSGRVLPWSYWGHGHSEQVAKEDSCQRLVQLGSLR